MNSSQKNYSFKNNTGHLEDITLAIQWVRLNIEQYGGNPKCLFLAGHSAGGHLVTQFIFHPEYAKAAGVDLGVVDCVILLIILCRTRY